MQEWQRYGRPIVYAFGGRTQMGTKHMPKRSGIVAVNNKVYAVRANFNRMLDVARETYKENIGDIHDLCTSLSTEHGLPLSLTYIEKGGGFWLTIAKDDLEEQLPRGFLNVTTKGAKYIFTTLELVRTIRRLWICRTQLCRVEKAQCANERCT